MEKITPQEIQKNKWRKEQELRMSQTEFDGTKIRVEKCKRIRDDLKSTPAGERYTIAAQQRQEEIRRVEMKSKQGEKAKKGGLEELIIDTRGYHEKRFTRVYISPTGEKISEELVMFVRIDKDGKFEWLTLEGKPLALNANLYDSRMTSQLHAEGLDYRVKVIPRINERGAYTGVVSIIEDKKNKLNINIFEKIGEQIKIDEQHPPKPESFFPPLVGNFFNEEDTPTLAGKIIVEIYRELIRRSDYVNQYNVEEIINIGKKAVQNYKDYVKEKVLKRWEAGDQKITFGIDRKEGADLFHFNGDDRPIFDHLFYFNKSRIHWRNPKESIVRAYITLAPQEINKIQNIFVDLCLQLYDAGIDFSAKCSSPNGLIKRTDNIVLYISNSDQSKASQILKNFLKERRIGKGHVMAATPDPQDGLSWAYEPNEQQQKIWQEVSGSSQRTSFNTFVATMAVARYLERLALAHLKLGNVAVSNIYQQEAKRVRSIINTI